MLEMDASKIYHEAIRRASLPQPFIRHSTESSLLLTAPNNIIFELFNTIVQEIPEENLMDFITRNLSDYLATNWTSKITQRVVKRLRREQAIDIKAGLKSMPVIGIGTIKGEHRRKSTEPARQEKCELSGSLKPVLSTQNGPTVNYDETDKRLAIKQIYDHIMWRIRSDEVTQITSLIIKQALGDGYKRGKLKAVAYDDIAGCFEDWRSKKLIKLYAFGNAPADDQRLVLSSTQFGDLTKWIANYIDGREKRQKPDLIAKLSGALRDKRKNCMFITNDINDAIISIHTGSIRCALVVDRLKLYEPIEKLKSISPSIESMVTRGQVYILSSLSCVQFAPDPTSDDCC